MDSSLTNKSVFLNIILILCIFVISVEAQELLIKQADSFTELFIKVDVATVKDIKQGEQSVTVYFSKKIKGSFNNALEDQFIETYEGAEDFLRVNFYPSADFAVFKDSEGIRIVGAKHKQVDNLLLSYGMGAPLLRKAGKYADDPVAEALLKQADLYISQNNNAAAVDILKKLASGTSNPYYTQEGLLRLGELLIEMGATNPTAYAEASAAMDRLIAAYPDSSRLLQALNISAKSKELSGEASAAAQAYHKIYELSVDAETKRNALEKIGSLYESIGKYENALEAYELYLTNFITGSEQVKSNIGKLYLLMGNKDKAYDYFKELTAKDIVGSLDPRQQLEVAKIFAEKGDKNKATIILEELANKPLDEEQNTQEFQTEVLYRLAELYKDAGSPKYETTLQRIMTEDENSLYGRLALLKYAEEHYKEKDAEEWKQFLLPVYNHPDNSGNLWERADLVIIKSLQNDDKIPEMDSKIDQFVKSYPGNSEIPNLLKMKEDDTFRLAKKNQNDKNYAYALSLYESLLSEFPDSAEASTIKQKIDDIYYDQAMISYNSKNYKDSLDRVNAWMDKEGKVSDRWLDLWEDSSYNYILSELGDVSPEITRLRCREYLVESPKLKYAKRLKDILFESFKYPYFKAVEGNENALVISMYNENLSWLAEYPDQEFFNKVKIAAARSLLNLGMESPADRLFQDITPMMTPEYASLGYDLCADVVFDVNRFSPTDFEKTVESAEHCGYQYALGIAKRYTKDINTSLKAQYMLSKNISDEAVRERLINDLYENVSNNGNINFPGYEEIYLDKGMQSFRKNSYKDALIPLKKYIDLISNPTEKKAEAMYYLGKSLINMNEREKGLDYYRQLVNTMPDSLYKSMAKSELEDDSWRRNLKN